MAKETGFVYYYGSKAIFIVATTCLSWLNGKRVSIRNSRRLNRLIPINERKVILKRKLNQESRSEKIADLIQEKEKRRTFARMNERTNARYLNKPEKLIYLKNRN